MEDWIKFNFNEHESEEEYLFAQEKMIARQEEKRGVFKRMERCMDDVWS